ncbi:MAG: hypothetical protein ABIO70_20840 [Pseudomonadota bacterium]
MRAVSVLAVQSPAGWDELAAVIDLDAHLGEALDSLRRVARPSFEEGALPLLRAAGVEVLVRFARQAPPAPVAREIPPDLPEEAARVLRAAQRHAQDGAVIGAQAWDPEGDAPAVRALHAAGLLVQVDGEVYGGRYLLAPDLPPAPEVAFDFADALMPETDDLPEGGPGAVALLHDLGSLAAAFGKVRPRRSHAGPLLVGDARRLGRQLGLGGLAREGHFEAHPRWVRALTALEALGAVAFDPMTRELTLEPGLEDLLVGETPAVVDRLARRLLDPDLRLGLPALRAALRQAGEQAVDEVVFLELVREQQREVLFPAWEREGCKVYPVAAGERLVPFDDDGWDQVEARILHKLLSRCERLGLIRRAPGVFAATPDGRLWAGAPAGPTAPVWIGSDLELFVPPDALTPWERFQVERLGRCLGRDVVDRYRLERDHLVGWLATHALEEALALLRRRARALPRSVVETLTAWAEGAQRVTLTCGVVLDDP